VEALKSGQVMREHDSRRMFGRRVGIRSIAKGKSAKLLLVLTAVWIWNCE
jgi:hypothetical protein